jgi:hypothetical protein
MQHATGPQPFASPQIDSVLAAVSGGLETNVRTHIMQTIEIGLRDYLAGLVNLNSLGDLGTPQVMIRVRTFQTILDEFRRLLDDRYLSTLQHIGLNIGFNFGISLVRILQNAAWIPLNYEALLKFWALFDSSAHMGHVDFQFAELAPAEATIDVKIQKLFLTLGYGHDEPLRHCNFMVGYLTGAADIASLLWSRWIKSSIYAKPTHWWRVIECTSLGQEKDDVTAFAVSLRPERFTTVRDTFALAISASQDGKWVEAMIDGRICLERALLLIVGHDPETRISFGRLLEQTQNVRAYMDHERWRIAYAACSDFAHQVKAHNEVAVLGHLFTVWECISEAENVQISPEQAGLLLAARDRYLLP